MSNWIIFFSGELPITKSQTDHAAVGMCCGTERSNWQLNVKIDNDASTLKATLKQPTSTDYNRTAGHNHALTAFKTERRWMLLVLLANKTVGTISPKYNNANYYCLVLFNWRYRGGVTKYKETLVSNYVMVEQGLMFNSTLYSSFWGRSSEPIIRMVQKGVTLQPSYNTTKRKQQLYKNSTHTEKTKSNETKAKI